MTLDLSRNHVPGYGGFVPNTREDFARTYGNVTRDALKDKVENPASPFPSGTVQKHVTPLQIPPLSPHRHLDPSQSHSQSQSQSQSQTQSQIRRSAPQSPEYYRRDQLHIEATLDRPPPLDEQHIPGYSGYVSPLRMPPGKSFGYGSKVATQVKEAALTDARNYHGGLYNPHPVDNESASIEIPPNALFQPNETDSKAPFEQPNEHKLPGYSGFIRGSQHHYGGTFGHMTKAVNRSPTKVYPVAGLSPDYPEPELNRHSDRHPDTDLIPGYTGFIRNAKDDQGKTYGRLTREKQTESRAEKETMTVEQRQMEEWKQSKAIENSAPIEFSDHRPFNPDVKHLGEAHQLPGYTGYIHRNQHKIGQTYGQMTREIRVEDDGSKDPVSPLAYLEHTGQSSSQDQPNPDDSKSLLPARWEPFTPTERTLGYTGYRPGNKYSYAETYGKITTNVEDKMKQHRPPSPKVSPSPTEFPPLSSPTGPKSSNAKTVHRKQDSDPRGISGAPTNGQLPGYTGYLPHNQDVISKTYGETSRECLRKGASPTLSRRDESHNRGDPLYRQNGHMPGYTGSF
eukprot:TRINITY_DN5067_c0_g1_i2.p1 TRINITY_DN5067_c0_g1~~TRINITY_DN5067_c0_g1_i2.p1  ORF type:complete len:567 (-),score=98.50 TRINITY_DN5067_c0_g1_i2:876-2576(-)